MPSAVQIRTQDPDLGCTIALWLADLLDQFQQARPAGTVTIDDDGMAGRPVRQRHLNWTADFHASRQGDHVHLRCSSSSIVLASRHAAEIGRKLLVRIRLATDAVPLDHFQIAAHQQRIRQQVRRVLGLTSRPASIRLLLRVDDFPSPFAGIDEFHRFHRIAVDHGLPYLLAVTPFFGRDGVRGELSAAAIAMLRACAAEGVEIALHGFSHISRYRNYASELLSWPAESLRAEVAGAVDYLSANGLETAGFVAPYNAYDPLTFGVLAERFPLICGGPESVVALGYRAGPSFLMQRLYVPSYRGAYDVSANRLERFDRLLAGGDGLTIPVTLHWANEVRDEFRGFRALCERLQGRTATWRDVVAGAAAVQTRHAQSSRPPRERT